MEGEGNFGLANTMVTWSATRNGSCEYISPTSEIKSFKEPSRQEPFTAIKDQTPNLGDRVNVKEVLGSEGISAKVAELIKLPTIRCRVL